MVELLYLNFCAAGQSQIKNWLTLPKDRPKRANKNH